jgi:eukaryotic-like serine/threonine-protein kinase
MVEDPLVGLVIEGRYQVVGRLGAGGMGSVYLAKQLNVQREVAVKVLASGLTTDPIVLSRFRTEADIIAELRHPNTLKLFDVGHLADGRMFIVTEYLAGTTLKALLDQGPLDTGRALLIIGQICDSLIEAHEHAIVHRDLKPANIFVESVSGQEIVKVLDFGIARLVDQPGLTATGGVIGTPRYMSPEQARGEEVDERSDVYSLGILFYECLCGRPPFAAKTPTGQLLAHIAEPPPPLRTQPECTALLPGIEALVMKMLEKHRDDRPANVRMVRRGIDELIAEIAASERTGGATPPPRQTGRTVLIAAAVAVLAMAAIGLVAIEQKAEMAARPIEVVPPPPTLNAKPRERALVAVPDEVVPIRTSTPAKTERRRKLVRVKAPRGLEDVDYEEIEGGR